MKINEIRESYLSFFESKGCVRKPSDVLVPKGDPTVLFTPAGMNQFKNEFLGLGEKDFIKATTCQKCLRTGDISNVGVTAYHHTFFEMLGNFSFGDYFKREAIHWAWEYLTDKKWLGLDLGKLTVSVYRDENDDSASDHEAYDIWNKEIGLSPERIAWLDEHENFWPAGAPSEGPDGVCGPCSEIFYHPDGDHKEVEIWNLVFTQFNRVGDPPGNLKDLPAKNIDTGMGLERTAAVMQGVVSNFEIDSLRPLCLAAAEAVGAKYEFAAPQGRPLRRIADHVRAVSMCIHEGVAPGNEKENYIVRQLLRRALLEGYLLGRHDPFLHTLVPAVVEAMGEPYPEIRETVESVANTIQEEEEQFLGIVERGLSRFEECLTSAATSGSDTISGQDAFTLHTQDGFLIELTEAMAARKNIKIDHKEFNHLMDEFRQTSKGDRDIFAGVMAAGPIDALRKTSGSTEFLGYANTESTAELIGIIAEKQLVDELEEIGHTDPVGVVLDQTPFYGEAGGQVGDTGVITGEGFQFDVFDTQKDGELIVHFGHLRRGTLSVGARVTAQVASEHRAGIRRAHSATHILHHALHQTIGEKATQRGSVVKDDALRFDFAHGKALSRDEIRQVEDIINARIAEGSEVATQVMDLADAKKLGAMALFGEKYPDRVRVVTMGEFSVEFCGGTHLSNTGQVGFCKITSEEPVAKGVRRITALTGPRALERIRETEDLLDEMVKLLKTPQPSDLPRRVEVLQQELRDANQALAKQSSQSVAGTIDELLAAAEEVDGVKIVACVPENGTREVLRDYADQLRSKNIPIAIVLGAEVDGKAALLTCVSKGLIERGVKASDCIKVAAKVAGGGGGGRPDMAEAGGKKPENLEQAVDEGAKFYREKLQG